MEKRRAAGMVVALLVSSVLVSAMPAQARSASGWDPSDSRGQPDIRRVRISGCCPYWIGVRTYKRWLGPATSGLGGGGFDIELDTDDDHRTDFRVRMRADAHGLRCGLFRDGERVDRGTAFRSDGGFSLVCGLSLLPVIDDQDRWRVLAFRTHTITDNAPNHRWYRGP
jgi:hypothetical protein